MGTPKAFINCHFWKLTNFCFKFGCRLRLQLPLKKINMTTCALELGLLRLCVLSLMFPLFFFSFFRRVWTVTILFSIWIHCARDKVHCSLDQQLLYPEKNILKMGPTALVNHSKIILLRYFQFSAFSKISCIRTDPTYFENLTIDYMFFIFLTKMSKFVIIGYYLLYDA